MRGGGRFCEGGPAPDFCPNCPTPVAYATRAVLT